MTNSIYTQERHQYQHAAEWELRNVQRALSLCPLLNSERESARLQAVRDILRERRITNRSTA